jgi:hypothetical protein
MSLCKTIPTSFLTACLVLVAVVGLLISFAPSYAQTVDCRGTITMWGHDRSMSSYMSSHRCDCSNGANRMPVCTPIGGGGGGGAGGGLHHSKYAMQGMMMQAIMAPMLSSLFAPPVSSGPSPEELRQQEIARQQAEAARIAAENAKKAALDAWVKAQSDEALRRQAEQEGKIKRGEEVHSQMQSFSGGKLEPFSFGSSKLELAPVSSGSFPTTGLNEFDKLMCSAFFSNMAQKATSSVDARFYADQAQLVMSGQPTYVDCKIPKASSEKMADRSKALKKTYETMNLKFKDLEGLQLKLDESKQKVTAAETKKEQAAAALAEVEKRASSAPPEQKEEIDDLTAKAMKELTEAEKELGDAKSAEQATNDKMAKLEGEIMQLRANVEAK